MDDPRATVASGRVLAARYRLVRQIGKGGMGVVWEAEAAGLGPVALKLLRKKHGVDPSVIERFRREALVLGWLDHPHVVRVHDAGESEIGPYIAMELVRGSTLTQILREEAALPRVRAVRIARQVLAALSALHAAGVVHRDVKPANVLVARSSDGSETAKLADLGVAHVADAPRLTELGQAIGTPKYMAPEQILGERVSAQSDVYAAGAVLYAMLSGRAPFDSSDAGEVVRAALVGDRPRLATLVPGLGPLADIVETAMSVGPTHRFATAAAMDAALVQFDAEPARTVSRWVPRIPVTTLAGWVATGEDGTRSLAFGTAALAASPAPVIAAPVAIDEVPTSAPRPRRKGRLLLAAAVSLVVGAGLTVGLLTALNERTPDVADPVAAQPIEVVDPMMIPTASPAPVAPPRGAGETGTTVAGDPAAEPEPEPERERRRSLGSRAEVDDPPPRTGSETGRIPIRVMLSPPSVIAATGYRGVDIATFLLSRRSAIERCMDGSGITTAGVADARIEIGVRNARISVTSVEPAGPFRLAPEVRTCLTREAVGGAWPTVVGGQATFTLHLSWTGPFPRPSPF